MWCMVPVIFLKIEGVLLAMVVVLFCALILAEIQNCLVLMSTLFDLTYKIQKNYAKKTSVVLKNYG